MKNLSHVSNENTNQLEDETLMENNNVQNEMIPFNDSTLSQEIEERKIRVKARLEQKKILMVKKTNAEQRKLSARKRRETKNEKLVEKMKKELCESGYCFVTRKESDYLNNIFDLKTLTREIRNTHKGLKQSFYVTRYSTTGMNSDISICFMLNHGYVLHNAVKYY
jgi:hypothetical protein